MKTFQEVRNLLSTIEADEYTYSQITSEDIPNLQKLLKDSEAWMSARAIFALSRLKNQEAHALIEHATRDKRIEVRVAIAVASPLLPQAVAEKALSMLLRDEDLGVKQWAINSIPENPSENLKTQLQAISQYDGNEYIKKISREKLSIIK